MPPTGPLGAEQIDAIKRWIEQGAEWPDELANDADVPPLNPNQRRENTVHDHQALVPDSTAGRVALWRAMHVHVDPTPHVLEDEIGLQLAAPDDGWRSRPDLGSIAKLVMRSGRVEV